MTKAINRDMSETCVLICQMIDKLYMESNTASAVVEMLPTDTTNDSFKFDNCSPTVECFVGRVSLLSNIRTALIEGQHPVVVISGVGGIGKSQLSRWYAKLHTTSYSGVRWISAESDDKLKAEFRLFADILSLNVDGKSDEFVLSSV